MKPQVQTSKSVSFLYSVFLFSFSYHFTTLANNTTSEEASPMAQRVKKSEWESECVSPSVMSNSLWSHGLQPVRFLCPWDFPGKNAGVGSHFLLQGIFPTQEFFPIQDNSAKVWTTNANNHKNESQKHYAKWRKSVLKGHILKVSS